MDPYAARRADFARLHETGCFVIPNPWDVGTARYLRHLGFKALATTSAGFQFSQGQPDTVWGSPVESVLQHVAEIVAATELPVNADFQSGHGRSLEDLAANVTRCVATGVAGLSIEDATGDPAAPLYELAEAVERVRAARAAIDATGAQVLLTARAEAYLVGHDDPQSEVLKRLVAFADAGADVLYAPGLKAGHDIAAVVQAVAPRPVNLLIGACGGLTVEQAAELGVRRISLGSALARAAWGGFIRAASWIAEAGRFDGLEGAASFAELDKVFSEG